MSTIPGRPDQGRAGLSVWFGDPANRRLLWFWVLAFGLSAAAGQLVRNLLYVPAPLYNRDAVWLHGPLVQVIATLPWFLRAFFNPEAGSFTGFWNPGVWVRGVALTLAWTATHLTVHRSLSALLLLIAGSAPFQMELPFWVFAMGSISLVSAWIGGSFYLGLLYGSVTAGIRGGVGFAAWGLFGAILGLSVLRLFPGVMLVSNLLHGALHGLFIAWSEALARRVRP